MKNGSCIPKDVASRIPLPFVRRYPFLDEVVRDPIVCSQYRYMSIVTDGGINPNPNINQAGLSRNNLMIEFDNGDVWKIDSETHNLNIERYGSFHFTNLAHDIFIGAVVQNGYGNLFLVLTMEKYRDIKKFKRHNPSFCVSGTLPAKVNGTPVVDFWVGVNRPDVGFHLVIPWIPLGYKYVTILFLRSGSTLCSLNHRQYCCDNTWYHDIWENSPRLVQGINATNRARWSIENTDPLNILTYCLLVTYVLKSDANF